MTQSSTNKLSVFLLQGLIFSSFSSTEAANAPATYRWAYRNPLSITIPTATDLGEGSYNGTVNSTSNRAPLGTPVLKYNHGATTAFLPNGSLAVIWQASSLYWEGSFQQAAYWALSDDDGETFGPATRIYNNPLGPIWGPNIHVQDDTLYMIYSGTAPTQCQYQEDGGMSYPPGGDLLMVTSSDNGASWSPPTMILPLSKDGGNAKLNIGKLVVNNNGTWLLAFWRETSGKNNGICWNGNQGQYQGVPGMLSSTDKGKTWRVSTDVIPRARGTPNTKWLIESVLTPFSNAGSGRNSSGLLQIFRSNTSRVWESYSFDGGATWSPAAPGRLQAPDSKSDITTLPDGSVLIAYNDAPQNNTPGANGRTNLTLARSVDGGFSWTHLTTFEVKKNAQYSYPTVTYHPQTEVVSVVYSVWQQPSDLPVGAYAPTPGKSIPPRVASRPQFAAAAPTQTAGRRMLSSKNDASMKVLELRPGRGLKQVPYNIGAWNRVSYGVRIAKFNLRDLLDGIGGLPASGGR